MSALDRMEDAGYPEGPRFLDAGEAALVVEFGRSVSPDIHERVLALDAALGADLPDAVRELVPTYRSLMIHYEPLQISRAALIELVHARLSSPVDTARIANRWIVPCCYEPPHGEDLAEMADVLRRPATEVVSYHTTASYRVYMYGFAPGFTYLGGVDEAISVSRRSKPRPPHAPGAVLVGGGLGAVATFAMPTGWYVVGRTPERLYAPERPTAFLLEPGDELRFEPIDAATFATLEARANAGEVVARRLAP